MAGVRNSFFSHSEITFFGPRRVFFPTFVFFKIYWVFTEKLSKFWRPIAGANSFTPEQVKKGRGFQAFRIYWVTQKILKNTKGPLSRLFIGGKTPQNHLKQICGFITYIKDTFCKNWAKSAKSVHSRVRNNPQTAIQGCHCQLNDQCRGPSIKEKYHLVGWLSKGKVPKIKMEI